MAQIEYFADLNLMGNKLIGAVQETVDSLPEKVVVGKLLYNSTDNSFYMGVKIQSTPAWKKIETPESISGAYATKTELTQGLAKKLDTTGTAARASADELGNKIQDTYVSQTAHSSDLSGKVNTSQIAQDFSTPGTTSIPSTKAVNDKFVAKASGKDLSDENYTEAEKTKLGGIATGAQVNVIEQIKVNNSKVEPVSKVVSLTIPTKVSDITNDSGFQTAQQVSDAIDGKISSVYNVKGSVATADKLPSDAKKGDVYNIVAASDYGGAGTNVVWDGTKWDALGGTVDLTDYYNKSAIDGKISTLNTAIGKKVETTAYNAKVTELETAIGKKVNALTSKPTAGTYTKLTINTDGLVTAGVNIAASDVPDLPAGKITSGTLNIARSPIFYTEQDVTLSNSPSGTAISVGGASKILSVDVRKGGAQVFVDNSVSGNVITFKSNIAGLVKVTVVALRG